MRRPYVGFGTAAPAPLKPDCPKAYYSGSMVEWSQGCIHNLAALPKSEWAKRAQLRSSSESFVEGNCRHTQVEAEIVENVEGERPLASAILSA
jgi:hypothetical protein